MKDNTCFFVQRKKKKRKQNSLNANFLMNL